MLDAGCWLLFAESWILDPGAEKGGGSWLYTTHCTLHTIHCTLHTTRYTLHSASLRLPVAFFTPLKYRDLTPCNFNPPTAKKKTGSSNRQKSSRDHHQSPHHSITTKPRTCLLQLLINTLFDCYCYFQKTPPPSLLPHLSSALVPCLVDL
jgi:hypothetical protein